MKYIKMSLLSLVAFLFAACEHGVDYKDVVYVSGTLSSSMMQFSFDGESSMGLTVTSTEKLENDLHITLTPAPEMLEAYNAENGRSFVAPPTAAYSFENGQVTINAGDFVSSQARLNIVNPSALEEGQAYCLPVTISQVDSGTNVLESCKTVYVKFVPIITTQAINLNNNRYYTVPSFLEENAASSKNVKAMSQMTMECKVFVDQFCTTNPYISSVIGIEERWLIRFGDVSCDNNQVQLAAGKTGDTAHPMTLPDHFATGRWYHLATTYDGSTVRFFVDGVEKSAVTGCSGNVDLTWDWCGGFHIGFSESGRKLRGCVSEARVWTVARTAAELQDGLCYVDPLTPGLEAYWRFNGADEDEKGNVTDLTGHGHTAIASGTGSKVVHKCPF